MRKLPHLSVVLAWFSCRQAKKRFMKSVFHKLGNEVWCAVVGVKIGINTNINKMETKGCYRILFYFEIYRGC